MKQRVLDEFISAILEAAKTTPAYAVGKIETVNTGTTPPTVTVDWNGSVVPAKCPREFTAVVGQVVLMARFGSQLLILRAY